MSENSKMEKNILKKNSGSSSDSNDHQEPNQYEIDNLKVNKLYLWILVFFAAIGGFLFGYDTSVIAGANLYVDNDFKSITTFDKSMIVSMALLGAAVGSLFGGPFADKFGRKLTIFAADIWFTGGWLLMAFSPSIAVLIVGRFVVGIGIGVAAMVVPVYLAEVAPIKIRGAIVNLNVVFITGGQFLALCIWLLLGDKWRWMLGIAGIPSFLQAIGILFFYVKVRDGFIRRKRTKKHWKHYNKYTMKT